MIKKTVSNIIALLFVVSICEAQTPIIIPDTLSGSTINLYLKDSTTQFYPSINTATIGYNGSYLGPTIIINKGQSITLNVHNQLNDTTTTHWHGLHVAPMNDGSPHNQIMAGATWSPSFTSMDDAATYWYHPHLHMKTMKQVLKGASGLIIVRDAVESALALPRTYGIDDFPLVCQWKTFDVNKQIVMDDELDNATMINGNVNGYLNVPAQMVRLRLLNGSSHRFFMFAINDNRNFQVISGDESLLNAPVTLNKLQLAPGERAEIVVDFSGQNGNTYYLKQLGTQLPSGYPGGPAGMMGTPGPLDDTDFNLLQFNVTSVTTVPTPITALPTSLVNNSITPSTGAGSGNFQLQGQPMNSMTNFTINGVQYIENVINFNVTQDSTMIWSITNQSMMPHPWHIHGNHFYVQTINGSAPPPQFQGKKDVVVVPPQGGTATLIMKYIDFSDSVMPYMYHCHISSHEDLGMMGQFIVNPKKNSPQSTGELQISNISFYPNPIENEIKIDAKNETISSITLHNSLGQIIEKKKINSSKTTIDASKISTGQYYLSVEINKQLQTIKFLKK
ncbi:MAG: multicopper oxidase domain-containing protein [Bacteroidetes bacterium]|nr:multicopper oxidase domain-containing protein [Bacteroidota bacterium]